MDAKKIKHVYISRTFGVEHWTQKVRSLYASLRNTRLLYAMPTQCAFVLGDNGPCDGKSRYWTRLRMLITGGSSVIENLRPYSGCFTVVLRTRRRTAKFAIEHVL